MRKMIIALVLLATVLSACSLGGGATTEPKPPAAKPTIPPKVAVQPTAEPPPPADQAAQPTEAAKPTAQPPKVEQPVSGGTNPTATVAAAAGETLDDFEIKNDKWFNAFYTTSQAIVGREETKPERVLDSILSFNVHDKESYYYKFWKEPQGADVVLEAKFASKGQGANGISLQCRGTSDFTKWIEARVSTGTSDVKILLFDKARRDEGKNPYADIKIGVFRAGKMKPSSDNIMKFSCIGSKFTVEVNGEKFETSYGELMEGGLVGIGVQSYAQVPVLVDWAYFKIKQP